MKKLKAHITTRKTRNLLRFFDIHITNHCQLSCKHCYLPMKCTRHMSLNMFKGLCHDFVEMKHPIEKVDIILSGGEPLVHPEFPKFVEYLRSINHPIRLSSNGLLVPKYIDLFESRDGIQVSIDGDKSAHDLIRGDGMYNCAVDALTTLKDAGVNHSTTMALCQENLDTINHVIDLCNDTGTNTLNITLFQPHQYTSMTPISFDEWLSVCNTARRRVMDEKMLINIPTTCIEVGCIAGILGLSVLPDGTYWDCSRSQIVIGKYPDPIKNVMNWDLIDKRESLDSFDTCCRNMERN